MFRRTRFVVSRALVFVVCTPFAQAEVPAGYAMKNAVVTPYEK